MTQSQTTQPQDSEDRNYNEGKKVDLSAFSKLGLVQQIENDSQIQNLYRVSNLSGNIMNYYSNDITTSGECVTNTTPKPETPCAFHIITEGDYVVSAKFVGDEAYLDVADQIMRSLEFVEKDE